jgi:AcrR family transcriptional regulator
VPETTATTSDEPAELSPRERRRKQRMDTSREQILDTAEELFGNQGYRATSLQQVAERCEFSVGALYQFFAGKEELLRAVMARRGVMQLAQMRAAVTAEEGPDDLLRLVDVIVAFHRRYPEFGRLSARLYSSGSDAPAEYDLVAANYQEAMDLYAEVIVRGQVAGRLRPGDPQVLARLLSSMVTTFHLVDPELAVEGPTLAQEEFRQIVAQAFAA